VEDVVHFTQVLIVDSAYTVALDISMVAYGLPTNKRTAATIFHRVSACLKAKPSVFMAFITFL